MRWPPNWWPGLCGLPGRRNAHYLILYQSTKEFAEESGKLLEDLYKGTERSLP